MGRITFSCNRNGQQDKTRRKTEGPSYDGRATRMNRDEPHFRGVSHSSNESSSSALVYFGRDTSQQCDDSIFFLFCLISLLALWLDCVLDSVTPDFLILWPREKNKTKEKGCRGAPIILCDRVWRCVIVPSSFSTLSTIGNLMVEAANRKTTYYQQQQ